MPKPKPSKIDAYFATLSADKCAALQKLRRAIQAAAPGAEEGESYGLPAFLWKGKPLAAFAAAANHCSFFPMSGHLVAAHSDLLKNYDTSKGTIRFPIDKPLPAALVRKIVKARMAEIEGNAATTKKPKAAAVGRSPRIGAVARSPRAVARSPDRATPLDRRSPIPVNDILAQLKRLASKAHRDGLARYGLPADNALGVPMNKIQKLAKELGRDHGLAEALWNTGVYEARLLACYVAEPDKVTPAEMDRWRATFDNWGTCDTVCFVLWDRTPHAFAKVKEWSRLDDEFGKRAAFALLASLAGHDKTSPDANFARCLPLIEKAATDDRNFVKKGVSWALRSLGRRSPELHAEALSLATRLAESPNAAARWIGKDAMRDLTKPGVLRKLNAKG
jgi:3-methyladenine DNA glycosylase AlkD/uncharacterized protein YdhG (YjbR/CyaY superfamily)